MAKFPKFSKLSKKERDLLLVEFCEALSKIKNSAEAAHFLKDLLSAPEVEMLAKRLKIAKLLLEGKTNSEVVDILKVSSTTVSRVAIWLRTSGEGYRLILERIPKKKELTEREIIDKAFKRKFSRYYWPELLWDSLIKELDWRKKKKIKKILASSHKKRELFEQLAQMWRAK